MLSQPACSLGRQRIRALLLAFVTLVPSIALAQRDEVPSADRTRLDMFRPAERELLLPLVDQGPVYLARFRSRANEMPAASVLLRVDATPAEVAAIVANPAEYPRFMPALDEVRITRPAQGAGTQQLAYSWRWQIGVFDLAGDNEMTIYPGNATRGHRIDLRATGGDLGHGRFQWRVRPDPRDAGRTLLELGARIDTRDANYLADQLARGGTSVQRTITLSLATMMTLAVKREAEGRRRGARGTVEGELSPPTLDPGRFRPLLARGDLVHLRLDGDRLDRVLVYARMAAPPEPVDRLMRDPNEFGRALVQGSHAQVLREDDDGVLFEWGIPVPIVGVDGRMRLRESGELVEIDGVSGAMSGGRWRFRAIQAPHGEAEVFGWARFDPADTSALLRSIVLSDSDFGHGVEVSGQIMLVRSLRTRVRRVVTGEAGTW